MRQDYLIGQGLVPLFGEGMDGACLLGMMAEDDYVAQLDPSTDITAMSLARIRQLAAHEVGHTLGFAHNFAASTYGRASVMDYPVPWVDIKDGKLDLSNAYATGIGVFDTFGARYAYTQFPAGANEAQELEKILEDGVANGMLYITDSDARPASAAHPLASLWDSGSDPIATLKHEMEVRRIGLSTFGLRNIPVGTPLSELERQLLPLYLHHRYQLQSAVKSLGGVYFTYAVRTATGPNPATVVQIVPPAHQRVALQSVLATISVDALRIPAKVLDLIPPPAFGYGGSTAEPFARRTDPTFDPIGAATIAADLAIGALLQPQRAARTIEHHARNAANPGFDAVVAALVRATWSAPRPADGYGRSIQQAVQSLTVTRLMDLAASGDASPHVRAEAAAGLRRLRSMAAASATAHAANVRDDIDRFLKRPDAPYKRTDPLATPAGEPIGGKIRGGR